MAEENQEVEKVEPISDYEDTLNVLEKEFANLHADESEETLDASVDEGTTANAPTYKEAEEEQQKSISAEDGQSATPTEEISTGSGGETPTGWRPSSRQSSTASTRRLWKSCATNFAATRPIRSNFASTNSLLALNSTGQS